MTLKKQSVLISGLFTITTFLLFYVGVKFGLKKDILLENYLAYFIFSVIVGLIVTVFSSMRHQIGLIIFIVFYVFGFGSMIYTFFSDVTGWQDLAGLLQMMMIVVAGTVLGAVALLGQYLFEKTKS